jgi:hypothetical protein
MTSIFDKDPNEKLDYKFSFSPLASGDISDPTFLDYLETDETLLSFNLTASLVNSSGCIITISGSALTDSSKSVQYWASGGYLHGDCKVSCLANTSGSRIVERTMTIQLVDK